MPDEAVPVAREGERNVEHVGVRKRLMNAIAHRLVVVLCFDKRKDYPARGLRAVFQAWYSARDALRPVAPHDDATAGQRDFFQQLGIQVPSGCSDPPAR
ncbi:hypothetical protein P0D73_43755 [Paraburkholderia sp. RL18-101-BIB-B]